MGLQLIMTGTRVRQGRQETVNLPHFSSAKQAAAGEVTGKTGWDPKGDLPGCLKHLDWCILCFLPQDRSVSQGIRLRRLLAGKQISWFKFPSTFVSLGAPLVSSLVRSLGAHDVPSLLIAACQLWCHAQSAQSCHSATTIWAQEAKVS